MYNLRLLLTCLWLAFVSLIFAQQSILVQDPTVLFNSGKSFYEEQQYAVSNTYLQDFLKVCDSYDVRKQEAEYTIIRSNIALNKQGVESEIQTFISENQGSYFSNSLGFELARLYYYKEKYRLAYKIFEDCKEEWLGPDEQEDYYYQYAYTLFKMKKYKLAKPLFEVSMKRSSKYNDKSLYYYSFLQYRDENYDVALSGFEKLYDKNFMPESVPYYLAQVLFVKERYDELLAFAPELIKESLSKQDAELNRIIGDSYYKLGDYDQAIIYLEAYQQSVGTTLRQDLYHLGMAYYQKKDYASAAETLAKVTALNDPISQNAYSFLGECFVRLGDKDRARLAFETASKYKFDPLLREDAFFNYVKLSYETAISPFNGTIALLEGFIEEFPESDYKTEIYDLMYKSYMTTNSFKAAASSIQKLKSSDLRIAFAKQRIMYYRGVELYNEGNFKSATHFFVSSLEGNPQEKQLKAKALYWLGDTYYQLEQYEKAMLEFNNFMNAPGAYSLEVFPAAHYNMAYCFFKVHNYNAAINWWRKYTQLNKSINNEWITDAYNRIGDCYFLKRDFYNAIKYYSNALNHGGQIGLDYAAYQKGLCQGLSHQYDAKVATMNSLLSEYPESPYADDANFELGRTWVVLKRYNEAIKAYKQIPLQYPNSKYASKGLLNAALAYYNSGDIESASGVYKQVVSDYKGSEEARAALLALKNISIDQNSVSEYVEYAQKVGIVSIEEQERDSLTFTAAERMYMAQEYESAVAAFAKYQEDFTNGAYVLVSYFFMADAYMQLDNMPEAIVSLEYIVKQARSIYTEQALEVLCDNYYGQNEFKKALEAYKQLLLNAEKKENILKAKIGIMECNYALQEEGATILAVEDLMKESLRPTVKNKALYYQGKSYMSLDNPKAAKSSFEVLAQDISYEYGAEAKYLIAEMLYNDSAYAEAKEEIFDFINKGSAQQYWLAKVFILLSDIYLVEDDLFQAKQYLLSIKDNYKQEDDILTLVDERLTFILNKESDENKEKRKAIGQEFERNDSVPQAQ